MKFQIFAAMVAMLLLSSTAFAQSSSRGGLGLGGSGSRILQSAPVQAAPALGSSTRSFSPAASPVETVVAPSGSGSVSSAPVASSGSGTVVSDGSVISGAPVSSGCGCGGSAPAPIASAPIYSSPVVSAPVVSSGCGCGAPAPAPVPSCGCAAPTPAPAPCCGGGRVRLMRRGCGCN